MSLFQRLLATPVPPPDYAGLSGVVFHGLFEGLVTNTNNGYGTVDASDNVTTWKSVSPHATGNDFDDNGTSPTLTADGISLGGSGNFRHSGASSVFNFMHYNATFANLKWCVHGVFKVGTSSNPNATYGILGNAGGTTVNKGIILYYDDASPLQNKFLAQIYNGTSDIFIENAYVDSIFPPNQFIDFWMEIDMSLQQADQCKIYINGFRYTSANYSTSSTPVTTPTYDMEIGAFGNGVLKGVMTIKEFTIQSSLNTDGFRANFIRSRMHKYAIAPYHGQTDGIFLFAENQILDTFDEGRYYLGHILSQKPSDPNVIVAMFHDSTYHFYAAASKVSVRKSIDKGVTWGAKTTAFDPSGADASREPSAGYDSNGRLHLINTTITAISPASTCKLWYLYSDDDGDTWSTPLDITSTAIAVDGQSAWRNYSSIIENNGRLMCVVYKIIDETNAGNTSLYLIYSDDYGANWGYKTVMSLTATPQVNECDIIALSSSNLMIVGRNETTFEWSQFMSTNNGDTWGANANVTFQESLTTVAGPPRLKTFLLNGTLVVAAYILNRQPNRYILKVVYGKASTLIASGTTGWNFDTKVVLYQGNSKYLHYGDVCYYDGDFNAIATYALETPGDDYVNSDITIRFPTSHYEYVKATLGL